MVTLFRKKRPKQTFACYNSQDAQKGLVNLDDWHIYNYLNPFSAIYNYVRPQMDLRRRTAWFLSGFCPRMVAGKLRKPSSSILPTIRLTCPPTPKPKPSSLSKV